LAGAALVVTGEGAVDRTSAAGKVTGTVARVCAEAGVRCAVFGGRVDEALPGTESYELDGDLAELGERLGRSL
jgi:glycerate kinase